MPKNQVTKQAKIANTIFADAPDKAKIKFAGIIKKIEDKETTTGTAKRFKGDFAMSIGDDTIRAGVAFFPASIRDPLVAAVAKAGKWDSCEFCFTAEKSGSAWAMAFSLPPRQEMPRVLTMLNA